METGSKQGSVWRLWRRFGRWGMCLTLLLGLLGSAQQGQAVMLKMGLEYLAQTADTVVLGTVARQVSAWDTHYTAIHTDVTIAVERVILGTSGSEVTCRVAGGMVGGMGMRTSNDAKFQDGERVIVFLDTTATPGSVVGLQQGKLLVEENTVRYDGEPLPLDEVIATIRAVAR